MNRSPQTTVLLGVCIFLIGLLAGLISALLSRASGSSIPAAVRDGGAGFGATVVVCFTAAAYFRQT
ncbi:hypothetical protein ACWEO1_00915 [Kitasatospora cineracea]